LASSLDIDPARARTVGFVAIEGNRTTFFHLLVNTLLVSVINFTVWFAITFYVYLQTRSVFATGVIAGIFLVMTALTGIWFGSLVDHHAKKTMMQVSAVVSILLYAAALGVYLVTPAESFTDPAGFALWALIVLLMFGVIAGNIRTIALPTLVTVLIAEPYRDRANGLVGTTTGVTFLTTSVISGVLVAAGGMYWVLLLALAVLAVAIVHLAVVLVPGRVAASGGDGTGRNRVDLRGTVRVADCWSRRPAWVATRCGCCCWSTSCCGPSRCCSRSGRRSSRWPPACTSTCC
jgi:DHA3 family multidrug efflux protein-like MFS transporter